MAIVLNVTGTRVYMAPEYFKFGCYDGCQATVWALGMILVDTLSPYMAFSKPKQAYNRPPRISHHLSPGNVVTLFNKRKGKNPSVIFLIRAPYRILKNLS